MQLLERFGLGRVLMVVAFVTMYIVMAVIARSDGHSVWAEWGQYTALIFSVMLLVPKLRGKSRRFGILAAMLFAVVFAVITVLVRATLA